MTRSARKNFRLLPVVKNRLTELVESTGLTETGIVTWGINSLFEAMTGHTLPRVSDRPAIPGRTRRSKSKVHSGRRRNPPELPVSSSVKFGRPKLSPVSDKALAIAKNLTSPPSVPPAPLSL